LAGSISIAEFLTIQPHITVIDVRKQLAFRKSGLSMAGAVRRLPFDAENWWTAFAGHRLVVFCVHGHEVSKAVAGFLADCGLDAAYLEGGFEAYRTAGGSTVVARDDLP
jgi:thiosulfate sulfurtransferase